MAGHYLLVAICLGVVGSGVNGAPPAQPPPYNATQAPQQQHQQDAPYPPQEERTRPNYDSKGCESTLECVSLMGIGGSCNFRVKTCECREGFYEKQNVCKPKGPAEKLCVFDSDCKHMGEGGICSYRTEHCKCNQGYLERSGSCWKTSEYGTPCLNDENCATKDATCRQPDFFFGPISPVEFLLKGIPVGEAVKTCLCPATHILFYEPKNTCVGYVYENEPCVMSEQCRFRNGVCAPNIVGNYVCTDKPAPNQEQYAEEVQYNPKY